MSNVVKMRKPNLQKKKKKEKTFNTDVQGVVLGFVMQLASVNIVKVVLLSVEGFQ